MSLLELLSLLRVVLRGGDVGVELVCLGLELLELGAHRPEHAVELGVRLRSEFVDRGHQPDHFLVVGAEEGALPLELLLALVELCGVLVKRLVAEQHRDLQFAIDRLDVLKPLASARDLHLEIEPVGSEPVEVGRLGQAAGDQDEVLFLLEIVEIILELEQPLARGRSAHQVVELFAHDREPLVELVFRHLLLVLLVDFGDHVGDPVHFVAVAARVVDVDEPGAAHGLHGDPAAQHLHGIVHVVGVSLVVVLGPLAVQGHPFRVLRLGEAADVAVAPLARALDVAVTEHLLVRVLLAAQVAAPACLGQPPFDDLAQHGHRDDLLLVRVEVNLVEPLAAQVRLDARLEERVHRLGRRVDAHLRHARVLRRGDERVDGDGENQDDGRGDDDFLALGDDLPVVEEVQPVGIALGLRWRSGRGIHGAHAPCFVSDAETARRT